MLASKSSAPPETPVEAYKPAVYADDEIVDSVKGNPWHLAAHDPELYPSIKAADGKVFPVNKKNFDTKSKKQETPATQS